MPRTFNGWEGPVRRSEIEEDLHTRVVTINPELFGNVEKFLNLVEVTQILLDVVGRLEKVERRLGIWT